MARTPWLPTVPQIVAASERPLLAALDTTLELTVRVLSAEHPRISDDPHRGSSEPPTADEAIAASVIILATTLRDLIERYNDLLEQRYGDRDDDQDDVAF